MSDKVLKIRTNREIRSYARERLLGIVIGNLKAFVDGKPVNVVS